MFLAKLKSECLSCSICTLLYDEKEHTPRLLKCGDYFCELCIRKLIENLLVICPKCKDQYAVTTSDVSVFPKENTIRGLRDFITSEDASKEITCNECSGDNKIVHYCQDCELVLCNDCKSSHVSASSNKCDCCIRPIGDVCQEKLKHVQILGAKVEEQLRVLTNHKHFLQTVQKDLAMGKDIILNRVAAVLKNGKINNDQHCAIEMQTRALYDDRRKKVNEITAQVKDRIVLRESAMMNIQLLKKYHGLDFLKRSDCITKALLQSMETSLPENPIEYHEFTLDEAAIYMLEQNSEQVCKCLYLRSFSAWKSSIEMKPVTECLRKEKIIAILHLYNCKGSSVHADSDPTLLKATIITPSGKTREKKASFFERQDGIDIVYVPRRPGKHLLNLAVHDQVVFDANTSFIVPKLKGRGNPTSASLNEYCVTKPDMQQDHVHTGETSTVSRISGLEIYPDSRQISNATMKTTYKLPDNVNTGEISTVSRIDDMEIRPHSSLMPNSTKTGVACHVQSTGNRHEESPTLTGKMPVEDVCPETANSEENVPNNRENTKCQS